MGDSITYGQYIDPSLRWTAVIERRLRPWLATYDLELVALNRGVSGETTRGGLERFPADVQRHRPDLMTLQYGLNDCNCWDTDEGMPRVSERAYAANLVEMIERARRFGAREIVLATNHPTLRRNRMPSGELYEEASERYNRRVRVVAAETRVRLCDIREAFSGFSETELADLLLPPPDILHLSEQGNAYYADVIWPHVEAAVDAMLENERLEATTR